MIKAFVKQYLSNINWSKENIDFQVEGLLKKTNQYLKFDIRFLKDFNNYCNYARRPFALASLITAEIPFLLIVFNTEVETRRVTHLSSSGI